MTHDEQLAQQNKLDMNDVAIAIAESAYWSYSNSLSGAAGGRHTTAYHYFEWSTKPYPGQLVVEISARRKPAIDRVGVLESITQEPVQDWDNPELNGPPPLVTIWTIRCLDGRQMRWENCQFIVAPSRRGNFSS